MEKIDIHCHTTNRPLPNLLPESASLEAIGTEMARHGITKTVVLATYFPHRKSGVSNYRLHVRIAGDARFALFGSLDFEHYFWQGYNELEELARDGAIAGVKLYTGYQRIALDSPEFAKLTDLVAAHQFPLMFHGGFTYGGPSPFAESNGPQPHIVVPTARAYPQIPIIISHMAKPHLAELIRTVREHPNVHTDMSGLINSAHEREEIPACVADIRKFLGECGPDRLLFGTDFPVQTHADSITMIEQAMREYAPGDLQKVYAGNARRILRLPERL